MNNEWVKLIDLPDANIPLLRAALLIARDEYPDLDLDAYESRIGELLQQLQPLRDAEPLECVRAINKLLFDDQGFSGNLADYYDPRNSYINDVFDRRLGIPISLAVVYIELAQRLGLPAEGVSFPGHFLVRLDVADGIVVLDPFNKGRSLGADELRLRARSHLGDTPLDDDQLFDILQPAGTRDILSRMLRNLKAVYADREDWDKALRCSDRLVSLNPDLPEERRDRGLLYLQIGYGSGALVDLNHYLNALPQAEDAESIHQAMIAASVQRGRIN